MKKLFGLIIVLILSYWTVKPLFAAGYFPMHDDTQVARVVEMGRALRQGQFPVRWVSNLGYGYGYPIFNFYGPLPYYAGGLFYALGFSGLTATKLMMGLGLVLAGITMYVVASGITGISGGILAAVFYMYAPYRAVDAYVRGAVGEYWALIFLPLIFGGFWRVTHSKPVSGLLMGAAGLAGLIISHTILGYAGMIFIGLTALVFAVRYALLRQWKIVKVIASLALLGLGLSAFFWLPALSEMKYTNVASQVSATADYHDHFVCPSQLWNSIWGYGGSAKGCLDGFSFKVGKEHLLVVFIALLGLAFGVGRLRAKQYILSGLSIFAVSVFMMLTASVGIWDLFPFFAYIQYPWRFLAFAIFGISLAASGSVYLTRGRALRYAALILCIAAVLFIETKRFVPQYTYWRPAGDFETPADIRYRVSRISDEYLPANIVKPTKAEDTLRDTIPTSDFYKREINNETDTYKKYSFHSGQDNNVEFNVAYFPGWHYIVNVTEVTPVVKNGLPTLTVTGADTVVQMYFRDTPVRTLGNVLSVVSAVIFLTLYDRNKKKAIS